MTRKHVVVIGGGFGGLATVQALRRAPVDITLIDRRNHHLFQPLLYQVATAALAPSDIAEPLRGVLSRQDNVTVRLGEVTRVDVDGQAVFIGDERVGYDALVVAAGARTTWFGQDQWAPHAPGLKTIGDALEIRERVLAAFEKAEWTDDEAEREALLTFAVVGGGPTGVEVAGALREIACTAMARDFRRLDTLQTRVILVEAGEDVLNGMVPKLRAAARRQLRQLGVEVRTGQRVEDVREGVLVVDGEEIPVGTVVWAAGVQASPLGGQLGVPVDRAGRVQIEPDLSIAGHPEVMVIGDMSRFEHDGGPLPGVAPVAMQMGAHVARNLADDRRGRERTPFRYVDRGSMATIGRSKAVVDALGLKVSGYLAWLMWVFVHLMTLVGHRSRAVVFVKWAWAWFTFDRSSRLMWRRENAADRAEERRRAAS
jgi:NADH dehydrogenase